MKNSTHGFTLIEMILVIALIAIMIAFTIPNLRDGRKKQEIKEAADQFSSELRYAQTLAISQKVEDATQAKVNKIGVFIDTTQDTYTTFEDADANGQYTPLPTGSDIIINATTLQNNVYIPSISADAQPNIAKLSIFFAQTASAGVALGSPSCTDAVGGPVLCSSNVSVQFSSRQLKNATRTIKLLSSGLIEKP